MHTRPSTASSRARRRVAVRSAFRAALCSAISLGAGCAEPTAHHAVANVDVVVAPLVQAELSALTDFAFNADIVNRGSATVVYDRWCNWRLQQLVNGSWAPAYAPVCSAEGREIYQLWPGEYAVHRYPAHRSWRVGNGAQIFGTYRLVLTVYAGEAGHALNDLREAVVVSNSFTVR